MVNSYCVRRPLLQEIVGLPAGQDSNKEFFAKRSMVVEELDESVCWLELLADSRIIKKSLQEDLLKEALELVEIITKARKTAGQKLKSNKHP